MDAYHASAGALAVVVCQGEGVGASGASGAAPGVEAEGAAGVVAGAGAGGECDACDTEMAGAGGAGVVVGAGAAASGVVVGATVGVKRSATTTICLLNKQVSRVLLQNQTFMTTVRSVYSGGGGAYSPGSLAGLNMTKEQMHAFAKDFSVVPQLCSAAQLDAVFDAVNSCQDADDDEDALDGLEFNETLVRLGVLYGPGCDARFLNVESLEDDATFATALYEFLVYLHDNRRRDVPDIEALPAPRVKGLPVPASQQQQQQQL